jgi:hypothetical protein
LFSLRSEKPVGGNFLNAILVQPTILRGAAMPRKATPKDAELIMQLYNLRREPEMRKARDWWLVKFWPTCAEDFTQHAFAMGTQENNWIRQVGGYWGMASAFVLSGALNTDLFLQPSVSGEMFFIFAKVHPFLKELREQIGDPLLFLNVETVIQSTKFGRDRFKFVLARVTAAKAKMAAPKS